MEASTESGRIVEVQTGDRAKPHRLRKVAQIMEAARAAFFENGFDTTSMDAIARRAGVSKATLYTNFVDKDDLFIRLIEADCQSFAESIAEPIDENSTAEAVLTELARRYVKIFIREDGVTFHRTIVSHATRFPEVGRLFYEVGPKAVTDRVARFLQDGNQRGLLYLSDPKLAAVQFLSLVRADFPLRMDLIGIIPDPGEVDRIIKSGVQIFLSYYGVNQNLIGNNHN